MRLLDFFSSEEVINDCSFDALGLSNSVTGKNFISFLDDEKYIKEINDNTEICGLITKKELYESGMISSTIKGIVVVDDPRRVFFGLHNKLAEAKDYSSISSDTIIGKDCFISCNSSIDNKGVMIGDNVIIEDYVTVKAPCCIGNNVHIHSGAHIGGEGFEFKRYDDCVLDVKHCGSVEIGDNVIIWENTSIHRAVYPWDKTIISDWCRIGANSHVDHGAKIYGFAEICAGCTISGRVEIGKNAFIGPGVIVSNRIKIGDDAKVLIGSVVTRDVPQKAVVSGNFAIDHEKHLAGVITASQVIKDC